MHFDVIVEAKTPHEKAIDYGKEFLESAGYGYTKLTQQEKDNVKISDDLNIIKTEVIEKGY